jgi:hypothetical protein
MQYEGNFSFSYSIESQKGYEFRGVYP